MTISGYRVGYNTTDTPIAADNQGRMLPGREYGLVLATADHVKGAAGREALVLLPAGAEPSGGRADAALAQFATVEANAEAMQAYQREPLAEVAAAAGVDVSDSPNKAELVARIAVLDPMPALPELDTGEGDGMPTGQAAVPWTPPDGPVDHTEAPPEAAGDPAPEPDESDQPPKTASHTAKRTTRKAAR